MIEHISAGVEKLPLVVIQKCSQKVSRKLLGFVGSGESAMLMRQARRAANSAQVPEDGLQVRIFLECARQDHAGYRAWRSPHRVAHAAVRSWGKSFEVILVVGIGDACTGEDGWM